MMFPFFLALYNGSQVSIVALWATCFYFDDSSEDSGQTGLPPWPAVLGLSRYDSHKPIGTIILW